MLKWSYWHSFPNKFRKMTRSYETLSEALYPKGRLLFEFLRQWFPTYPGWHHARNPPASAFWALGLQDHTSPWAFYGKLKTRLDPQQLKFIFTNVLTHWKCNCSQVLRACRDLKVICGRVQIFFIKTGLKIVCQSWRGEETLLFYLNCQRTDVRSMKLYLMAGSYHLRTSKAEAGGLWVPGGLNYGDPG